jgi:o-succinylbenzoate synthase
MDVTFTHCTLIPYTLPLRPIVYVQKVPMVQRTGLRVALHFSDGTVGLGEVSPWPGFAGCTDVQKELSRGQQLIDTLKQTPLGLPAAVWGPAPQAARLAYAPFAAAVAQMPPLWLQAVQTAVLDALGQLWRAPMAALLAVDYSHKVPVHCLVDTAWAAQRAVAAGYRALKIKVGVNALDEELGRLCAIRSAVGQHIALRLDANGAWPYPVAQRAMRMFASVAPAWLEQPLAAEDLEGLGRLRRQRAVPIAVDESITRPDSLNAILAAQAADGVVIKPTFVGGPLQAMALAQQAQRAGLHVCITHALDGAIGRAMALHVALALGLTTPCGLGGALPQDIAPQANVEQGFITLPTGAGLGLHPAARAEALL